MNNKMNLGRTFLLVVALIALGGLSACGVGEADTTEVTEEALTVGPPIFQTCQGRAPDATMIRGVVGVSSPTQYGTSGCPKAYVVDAAPPTNGDETTTTLLTFADMWPRNERQCTGGKLKLALYSKAPGDAWGRHEGTFEEPLTWIASKQECQYPLIAVAHSTTRPPSEQWFVKIGAGEGGFLTSTTIPIRSFAGRTLRFAASALTPAGSTQPLTLATFP